MDIEFVVLDDEAGRALARRQATVMRKVLQWLHDNPATEPGDDRSAPDQHGR